MPLINNRQKELLETEAVAVATTNEDRGPNLIAVACVRVVDPKTVIITDNFMHHTPENIKRDSRICLGVWTKNWSEGYKFIGGATYQTSGKWVNYVKNMKENEGLSAKGAIIVTVEKIIKLI